MSEIFNELPLKGLEKFPCRDSNPESCSSKTIRHSLTLGLQRPQTSKPFSIIGSSSTLSVSVNSSNSVESECTLVNSESSSIKSSSCSSYSSDSLPHSTASSSVGYLNILQHTTNTEEKASDKISETDSKKKCQKNPISSNASLIAAQPILTTSQDSPGAVMARMKERHRQECRRPHYWRGNHCRYIDNNSNHNFMKTSPSMNDRYSPSSNIIHSQTSFDTRNHYQNSFPRPIVNQESQTISTFVVQRIPTRPLYYLRGPSNVAPSTPNPLSSAPNWLPNTENMLNPQEYNPQMHNALLYTPDGQIRIITNLKITSR
ncbi:hypothetical protein G6F56_003604 [Rhizopus delemar]|nr:hypothetical protein G6F56_003604 [Rhizopus delemar]